MKNIFTIKMSLATSLSGRRGGETIKKKWRMKKKMPISAPDLRRLKKKLRKMW